MIFTFSDDQHGRNLQAHYDSEGLVIRKSKLYEFTTEEKCTQNLNFFLQYLTCSLEGPTRILDVTITHPKTPKAIEAAKASSATVDPAARTSHISKPSNDAIAFKNFAIFNASSGSNIPGVSNDSAISNSPVAANAPSDPDVPDIPSASNVSNVSNASSDAIASKDLSVPNAPTAAVASNNHIASDVPDAPDYPNAHHSRSSSSAHTISSSSDGASKPTDSPGTPDTSFSSDSPNPHTSSNVLDTTIPSKRKYPTEEP